MTKSMWTAGHYTHSCSLPHSKSMDNDLELLSPGAAITDSVLLRKLSTCDCEDLCSFTHKSINEDRTKYSKSSKGA